MDRHGAAGLRRALRSATTWDGTTNTRPSPKRSADALVDICAFFNANHNCGGSPRHRPHVELAVDSLSSSPVAWTTDHAHLGTATTDAYLCDGVTLVMAVVSRVLMYWRLRRKRSAELLRQGGSATSG